MNDKEFQALEQEINLAHEHLKTLQAKYRGETGVDHCALCRDTDVTDRVEFGSVDGEFLEVVRCLCGAEFDYGVEVLSIYRDDPWICPECGAKLYFKQTVRVYEVRR